MIRQGVNYFPNAVYQVDTFHLMRELRESSAMTARSCGSCLRPGKRATSAFMAKLAEASARLTDERSGGVVRPS